MKHEDLVLSNELITEGLTLQTSVFQISTFINSCDKTKFSRFILTRTVRNYLCNHKFFTFLECDWCKRLCIFYEFASYHAIEQSAIGWLDKSITI